MGENIYNRAVYRTMLHWDGFDKVDEIERVSKQCKELILVLPDKWLYSRVFGWDKPCDPEHLKELWESFPFISQVVIIDKEHMTLENLGKLVNFDTVFIGNEYGKNYLKDKEYCVQKNIRMVSLAPSIYTDITSPNALDLALNNVPNGKKIICFGTGAYFEKYMSRYGMKHSPAYAIDNDVDKQGKKINNIEVYSPEKLKGEVDENILVILCAKKYQEQIIQLEHLGKYDFRTMLFYNDIALFEEFLIAARDEETYMARAREVLSDLMWEFHRVCVKYNLKYYVISGSLIGIIRHHGMIPWDDDIDVAMPRKDLEKLKNIANNEWNGNKYLFVDYCDLGNDTFHDLMPRLYFMQEKFPTKIMDKSKDKMKRDLADRLILDIYPMDNASDNIIKHKFNMLRIKILYNLLMGHRGYIDYEEYKKLSKWKVDLIKLVNNIGKRVPYSKLIKWMNKLIQIENKHDTQNYYMSSGPIYYVERTYSKKFFKEGKLMDFENMKVFVPSNPEGLLHAQNYGDFMKYPPYAMRKPSHYFNSDISIW